MRVRAVAARAVAMVVAEKGVALRVGVRVRVRVVGER